MSGSADIPKKDVEALERKTLAKLLVTPPQPIKKKEQPATPKKRGRPPKVKGD